MFILAQAAGNSIEVSPWIAIIFGVVITAVVIVLKVLDHFLDRFREKKTEKESERIVKAIQDALAPVAASLANLERNTATKEALTEVKAAVANVCTVENQNLDLNRKLWGMHDSYDADGRPKWYIPHNLPDVLSQISHTCERIVSAQADTLVAFKATADMQQQILQNQKQFLSILQNFQTQQASFQQGLQLLIQQVMIGRSGSTEIIQPPVRPRPPQD